MQSAAAKFLLLIIATILSLLTTHALHQGPQYASSSDASCIPHEREALLAFKQGITNDTAGILDSWQQDCHGQQQDGCRWRGVQCSNRTGHVLKLRLGNKLAGYIDDDNYYQTKGLVGQISRSLLDLEHLNHLDLSNNDLMGATGHIPHFLGSLKNLKYLNLSGIHFSGSVPPQLGNLTKLQYLDLSNKDGIQPTEWEYRDPGYTEGLKSMDITWVTHLRFLEHLDLELVNLSTLVVADWPQVVNMLPSLKVLRLSMCSLQRANQSIPHLNLTNLEQLDLSSNNFHNQSVASCWFWNLTSLTYLNLGSTNFYGQIPKALGDMTSLQVLDISDFNYFGWMDTTVPNLTNLCSLEILDFSSNQFNGDATRLLEALPRCRPNKLQKLLLRDNHIHGILPKWIGQLTSLVILDLAGNNMTGRLPASIGNCTSLMGLDLSGNHFSGEVPLELGMLTFLTYLHIENNDFGGVIAEEHFASLKSLQGLDMSYNLLSIKVSSEWQPPFRLQYAHLAGCKMGPLFPSWLQWMVGIEFIDISSAGIADSLPDWFPVVFSNVRDMNMSNNQLTRGLPANMETMSLQILDLSSNNLTGQIPPLPPNLDLLDISMNSLSGNLPSNFGFPNLLLLSLFSNHLRGRLPTSICRCESLEYLDFSSNFFEGELPRCLGKMQRITNLKLSKNSFSGEFPSFIENYKDLELLDLGSNKFTGRLPLWIGNLSKLAFLRLRHNRFSGYIPKTMSNLQCLGYFDLSNNTISGGLVKLKVTMGGNGCIRFGASYYHGAMLPIVMKGHQLDYGTRYGFLITPLTGIDLSSNNLSGDIPEDLSDMFSLNLSWNHLTGNIPRNIGAMKSLESLDLSRNKLSGEIPRSLSNLTYLGYLDLSYNNLTGRIPSGPQLDTLYAYKPDMYDGNVGLCGAPLLKNCTSIETSLQGDSTRVEKGPGLETFWFGLGLGFTVGLWVVICTMLINKPSTSACFLHFDRLYSKAHVFVFLTWARLTRKETTANSVSGNLEI